MAVSPLPNHLTRRLYLGLAMALVCLLGLRSFAQVVWDNGNGNNQWGTGANWSTNSVPTAASN
ncbi:MAG: sorting protein, partial [Verrucomicrobiota bacterium]|nr:sorting protein [Verrucomicrobiota bacterium]